MYQPAYKEFELIRDKLKDVASLLVKGETKDITEAAFLVGCLHTICCENATRFSGERAFQ